MATFLFPFLKVTYRLSGLRVRLWDHEPPASLVSKRGELSVKLQSQFVDNKSKKLKREEEED